MHHHNHVDLRAHVESLHPHHHVVSIEPLGPDASGNAAMSTTKAVGYGQPVKIVLAGDAGDRVELVWHVAAANAFGPDRRADRAADAFLAYDDFSQIPDHVRAIDVGAVQSDGDLVSLRDARELYVISEYAR